jgi:hypothetical protein
MKFRRTIWPAGPLARSVTLAALLAIGPMAVAGQSGEAVQAPVAGTAGPATTESQREAAALLKAMAEYLASLKSFSVTTRAGYDVVQSTGQKIEFGETRRLTLARPDRLRVEEVSSDGNSNLAIFDGQKLSVLNADAGVFAQASQPGTVDDALVYFVRDLRMRMPLALLLTTRLPAEFLPRVRTVDYVESTDIYGVPTHHIAGRADTVDFQFWITEGEHPLPLRVVVTYLQSAGQPQFWTNFTDWTTSPELSNTTFQFTPPKDARQIAFAVQVQRGATQQAAPADKEARP